MSSYRADLDVTTGCEDIMNALDECHARGFMYKAFGGCNEAKRQVNKCLGEERAARMAQNRDIARQKSGAMKQIWKEADE